MKKIRPIAIYLPQYHPMPINDEAWGKGFTEWTNVASAEPRFLGHYQPHVPADLGFYDLRLSDSREAQARLAKEYGIYGFCYYHYWFTGEQIMERPFQEVLDSGKPDFPFMLCWANENWSRAWEDRADDLLIGQEYSDEDDRKHIRALIPAFKDSRYIRIDGKPVFAIYNSLNLPDPKRSLQIYREEAAKEGLELYICRFESYGVQGEEHLEPGFDASIEFQPSCNRGYSRWGDAILHRVNKLSKFIFGRAKIPAIHHYPSYVKYISKQAPVTYKSYPCVCPGWDNSPRKKDRAFIAYVQSSPKWYKIWLERVLMKFRPYSSQENLLFINAWNEWGEGNHLEPDIKWGRAYLEATKEALKEHIR